MKKALVYTRPFCPYCYQALTTLERLGIDYTEISVQGNPDILKEMQERTGGTTVPQIFLLIGGADDLDHLEQQGALKDIIAHERL